MKYITKPCEIEAIQWTGSNLGEIREFVGDSLEYEIAADTNSVIVYIKTLEGYMRADIGDYIIKGLIGEFYPCKEEVFNQKYELLVLESEGN